MESSPELHILAVDRKLIQKLLQISYFKVTVVDSGLQILGLDDENTSSDCFNDLKAPSRNHPLFLLSGVGTNAIGYDLAPGCPTQPGSIECGYYILNIMKEIVRDGLDILVNNNVGGGKEVYTYADLDAVFEECSSYAIQFVFRE